MMSSLTLNTEPSKNQVHTRCSMTNTYRGETTAQLTLLAWPPWNVGADPSGMKTSN